VRKITPLRACNLANMLMLMPPKLVKRSSIFLYECLKTPPMLIGPQFPFKAPLKFNLAMPTRVGDKDLAQGELVLEGLDLRIILYFSKP
jgi:hypothetical protein